ncbi:Stomatin-like protein 2-mitochondrial [Plutella xylostella]|uniref:Stomatin-like protein 2-mitochondrial n=1 Tax=Plutella xylostella TaxID=51655 RepID=A0ABQ7Q8U7_PLUXY|nr:stomatin-like protein 2, mitochondrial [Plutella xylostella]KAG7301569.1 Stomatin-like protein 2-mitochondrial [Plutella xylostella]
MFVRSRLLFTSALPLRNAFRADFQNDFRSVYSIIARNRSTSPLNTIVMFVPQQEAWIVERMGKFHRILDPGLNLLWPIVDKIKYVQSLKEIAIDVPKQSAITADNVTLSIDGVLYLRIVDPYLASYGVEDPEFAITQLAQTTMRAELGQISLDKVFRERESLNISMVDTINKASEAWGITCLRYEIRDIKLPARVQDAMQMQVEAERRKRAAILESEGVRAADINVAEGKRQARILASEAEKQEQINKASGEAQAMLAVAQARARGLEVIASSLAHRESKYAASLTLAEQYVGAFNKLARTNNTLILPANAGDVSNLVAQAMSIYSTVSAHNTSDHSQQPETSASIDPLLKLDALTEKSSTLAGSAVPKDDLAEYYSDDEEREKALEQRNKEKAHKLDRET